jgi:chorismate synthase
MSRLDYTTAGESHGAGMLVIVSGLPADLVFDETFINAELARRQGGFGRAGRMNIEDDRIEVLGGLRGGRTIGSPVAMLIRNRDSRIDDPKKTPPVHRPRPGHADLAGAIKYLTTDCRNVLERASARETAARTAAGALARLFLRELGIETFGFVRSVGVASACISPTPDNWRTLVALRDASETYCPDPAATAHQMREITRAKHDKDTLGGQVEAHIFGCPPGIGSCTDWRARLDAQLAYAVMSIQAIKAVEIGLGVESSHRPGSHVHDPIRFDPARRSTHTLGFERDSNNAGGLEGGMTNGQPIVVRATMKPISTLGQGMPSVDLRTLAPESSQYERSDICAVPAASVVVENVAAFEVARAVREKFGGDSLREVKSQVADYLSQAREVFGGR